MKLANTVRVRNLDRLFQKLKGVFEVSGSPELLKGIAKFSRDRIYQFTKAGKSLADKSGNAKPLLPTKYLTKKIKKWWEAKGKPTGALFNWRRSNLTMTGQMLDALSYSYNRLKKSASIFVKDTSRPIEGPVLRGKKPEKLTNAQVARRVARDGRPFLGMDDLGKRRIIQLVREQIRNEIRKNGLRK